MTNFACSIFEYMHKFLNLIRLIIVRDIRAIYLLITFQLKLLWCKRKNKVFLNFFDENVRKYPNKTAIIYHDEHFTFQDVANLANKISNWIELSLHLGHDQQWELFHNNTINDDNGNKQINDEDSNEISNKSDECQTTQFGLFFSNIPELASFIIGIARVRCASVLFNTNHRRDMLLNAFRATNCKVFIFESIYLSAIQEIASHLPDIQFFMYDRNASKDNVMIDFNYNGFNRHDLEIGALDQEPRFSAILNSYPTTLVLKNYPHKINDIVNYIFTSGTTGGNIKAASVDNIRQIASFFSQYRAFNVHSNDNIYICLPCYHSFAGITGLGYMFIGGSTITLADKFSASKFWYDCFRHECTVALYIGETCRYLLSQPITPEENKHSLRIMIGLGLKKEIWSEFKTRFNIKQIGEYYGSTEGNIQIYNIKNVEGSCGFIPYYFGILCRFLFPIYLIKFDQNTMELVRKDNGLCVFAKPGETGMLIGEIRSWMSFTRFLGYTSVQESSKKIIRNVRCKGDFAFVSGDLMIMDFYGNLYFKDRTGDTFRWKGENVSTTEVENIISSFLNHQDSVVYGVTVPNYGGSAGMLAINDRTIDLEKFYQFVKIRIPNYAIPKFIRISDKIEITSTLKYIKYTLREEGFNPERMKSGDELFYFDRKHSKYLPIDHESYEQIMNGNIQIS